MSVGHAQVEGALAFASLSRRGQLSRLRRLGRTALADYGLEDARLTLLRFEHNTTFRVDASRGRYLLRVNRPQVHGHHTIGSEMAWLGALRRDTDLGVPEPVAALDGSLVVVVSDPGVPGTHSSVLLRWLDGRFVDQRLAPVHLRRVGALAGQLQQHAATWEQPAGFFRPRVDTLTNQGKVESIAQSAAVARDGDHPTAADADRALELVEALVSPRDAALFAKALEVVWATSDDWPRRPAPSVSFTATSITRTSSSIEVRREQSTSTIAGGASTCTTSRSRSGSSRIGRGTRSSATPSLRHTRRSAACRRTTPCTSTPCSSCAECRCCCGSRVPRARGVPGRVANVGSRRARQHRNGRSVGASRKSSLAESNDFARLPQETFPHTRARHSRLFARINRKPRDGAGMSGGGFYPLRQLSTTAASPLSSGRPSSPENDRIPRSPQDFVRVADIATSACCQTKRTTSFPVCSFGALGVTLGPLEDDYDGMATQVGQENASPGLSSDIVEDEVVGVVKVVRHRNSVRLETRERRPERVAGGSAATATEECCGERRTRDRDSSRHRRSVVLPATCQAKTLFKGHPRTLA